MNRRKRKMIITLISICCVTFFLTPINVSLRGKPISDSHRNRMILPNPRNITSTLGTEYWALLFAVGVYRNHPDQDRPSMLTAVNNLYDVLLESSQWKASHIHLVSGTQATGENLIREFFWLLQNVDYNDMVLVYLTTHGSPLYDPNGHPLDLPPRDEADGADEILIMYDGFDNPFAIIWDDLLNFFLSLLKAKGVCLIVDSCFSGGFNDFPYEGITPEYSTESFIQGMMDELAVQNRVVLMSSEEDTVSYGSYFSNYLIQGFEGAADSSGNGDGINSAEESFYYAQHKVDLMGLQHPTILDLYNGEFPVTS